MPKPKQLPPIRSTCKDVLFCSCTRSLSMLLKSKKTISLHSFSHLQLSTPVSMTNSFTLFVFYFSFHHQSFRYKKYCFYWGNVQCNVWYKWVFGSVVGRSLVTNVARYWLQLNGAASEPLRCILLARVGGRGGGDGGDGGECASRTTVSFLLMWSISEWATSISTIRCPKAALPRVIIILIKFKLDRLAGAIFYASTATDVDSWFGWSSRGACFPPKVFCQHANSGPLASKSHEDERPVEGVDEESGELENLTAGQLDAEEAKETE